MSVAAAGRFARHEAPRGGVPKAVALGLLLTAGALGPLLARWPVLTVLGLVAAVVVAVVAARPQWATYLYLGVTPLIVGIDRSGQLIPARPNEYLLMLLWVGFACGAGYRFLSRRWLRLPRPHPIDVAVVALAVTSSLLPLLGLYARGAPLTTSDLLYAMVLWKLTAVYVLVRLTVRTAGQARRALGTMLGSVVLVALIGLAQALHVFDPGVLSAHTPSEDFSPQAAGRATSTIGSSLGFGDLMVFTAVAAAAWYLRLRAHRVLLVVAAVCVLGAIASGQASSVLALVVAGVALGWLTGHLRLFALAAVPVALVGLVALWPVIQSRLANLDPRTGLPASWFGPYGRLSNLQTYFWPRLDDGLNWLLGVQVSARVPAPDSRMWIYIESGYTWLLWSGGLAFLVAFAVFAVTGLRRTLALARSGIGIAGVLGVTAWTVLVVEVVVMGLDPHLTLRGGSDVAFPLLAMAVTALATGRVRSVTPTASTSTGETAGEGPLPRPRSPDGRSA